MTGWVLSSVASIMDDEPKVANRQTGLFSNIRRCLCNTYNRLFIAMVVSNLIPLSLVMATNYQASAKATTALSLGPLCINMASANSMICTAIRSPIVINSLFLLFGSIPRSAPLWLRRRCCKVFHFGGVHSGTGVAVCVWTLAFVFILAVAEPWGNPRSTYIFGGSVLLMLLLLIIVAVAIPSIRRKCHDVFELTHRFAGWVTLMLLWMLLYLSAWDEVNAGAELSMAGYLVDFPAFWFLCVSTLSAIWPWIMLRNVDVDPEYLSPHATRLHFRHRPTNWGQGLSLAKHPLRDWHSFAAFTDRFDTPEQEFSCLVSNAGDWTRSVIQDRPARLWVRAIPVYGVGYVMKLFNRLIVVATGSGIGPCLSFIGYDDMPPMRVVWQTRKPLKTYGQRTLDLIKRLDSNPLVYDTDQTGRVDMLPVICNMVGDFQAEAVIVISNPSLTKRLVYELEVRGIPAYGPIFDS